MSDMTDVKYLKAIDIQTGSKSGDKKLLYIICIDDDQQKYAVPFTFKDHYTESVLKTINRLSPIHLSANNIGGNESNE